MPISKKLELTGENKTCCLRKSFSEIRVDTELLQLWKKNDPFYQTAGVYVTPM